MSDVWTTCAPVIFRVKVSCTRGTSVDGIKLWLLLKCLSLTTTVLFRTTFTPGRSFPTYFEWNDSWVQTFRRTADDYLTVQNQVVAMGTSFGEVILNRSNLEKQQVTIWKVWDKKVLATLESVKEKKKEVWRNYHGIHSKRNLDYNQTLLIVHVLSNV